MNRVFFSVVVVLLWGCAIAKNNADFSVGPTGQVGQDFRSSTELLVSGLVSESIGIASRGRLFDAEARLRKALALTPSSPTIKFNLAVVLGQQGHADEAVELLKELRMTQGDHPRYALAMADAYAGQRELEKARDQLKLAFEAFSQVQNWPQAALVARSIANLAFADGVEQEALCYSYEAFFLDQSAAQLGYHASMLVALNQFVVADTVIGEQLDLNPALGAVPRVHLARALARSALGNADGALREVEVAQDLSALDPEIGAETNVVWWLLQRQVTQTPEMLENTKLQESLEGAFPEVLRLKDKPTYGMVGWPRSVHSLLDEVQEEEP